MLKHRLRTMGEILWRQTFFQKHPLKIWNQKALELGPFVKLTPVPYSSCITSYDCSSKLTQLSSAREKTEVKVLNPISSVSACALLTCCSLVCVVLCRSIQCRPQVPGREIAPKR